MTTATCHETIVEYHRDTPAITNSAKEIYRKSPRRYHGQYITKTIPFDEPTIARVLGNLTHGLLLEPDSFCDQYIVAPKSCRARSGGVWWSTKEEAEASLRTPVLASHVATASRMADAVRAHATAWKLLSDPHGIAERTIRWTDPLTGLACKCRPDWLIDHASMTAALDVDLKTAEDPSPEGFARAAAKYGYHRQAAWYLDGIEATLGKPAHWVFVVVGKTEPHDVYTYQLCVADITLGRSQNTRTLADMAATIATNRWLAPGQDEIQILELPRWARSEDDE